MKNLKQYECLSLGEWLNNDWENDYDPTVLWNTNVTNRTNGMDLCILTYNKTLQVAKHVYYDFVFVTIVYMHIYINP